MIDFNKAFIDTNPFIYFLEEADGYYEIVTKFFENAYMENRQLVTSTITTEEYCVFPYRKNDFQAIQQYEDFLEDMSIVVQDITSSIAKTAARIRAEYKHFKSMDALQLAAAVVSGCDLFITNDKQLKQYKEIKCITMDDLQKYMQ